MSYTIINEYSIRYSIEYSSSKLLDSGVTSDVQTADAEPQNIFVGSADCWRIYIV